MQVEDGTGLPDADSYVSVAEFQAFAASRGHTVPTDEQACSVLLVKATDYLEGFSEQWIGRPLHGAQGLSWPRWAYGVAAMAYRPPEPPVAVPVGIKRAQMLLALDLNSGVEFDVTETVENTQQVKSEKIGPIEVEYVSTQNGIQAVPRAALKWLSPFFKSMMNLQLVRA